MRYLFAYVDKNRFERIKDKNHAICAALSFARRKGLEIKGEWETFTDLPCDDGNLYSGYRVEVI